MPLSSTPTPTPWKQRPGYESDIQSSDGHEITTLFNKTYQGERLQIHGTIPWDWKTAEANAALIAKAVKAFEPMREALENAVAILEQMNATNRLSTGEIHQLIEMRAALKLAGDA